MLCQYSHCKKKKKKKMLICQTELDVNEDGFLSSDDLLQIFDDLSQEKIKEIIEEVDLDADGMVNFDEFKQAMRFEPAF
ncbi:hypothetical protein RFI_19242, partial [Reticulomyxa filosa]